MQPRRSIIKRKVLLVENTGAAKPREFSDALIVEEPLEIRLEWEHAGKRIGKSIAVTMRTPGHDYELTSGFLFTEGIVKSGEAIAKLDYCVGVDKLKQQFNQLTVRLRPGVKVPLEKLERNFYTSSSCGVCGKATLDALKIECSRTFKSGVPKLASSVISTLPESLRAAQKNFEKTGGVHAAGLFTMDGKLLDVFEDVGRHNAVDKLIGSRVMENDLDFSKLGMVISGRIGFEIVQKAIVAGIPIIVAVGAPSSLSVELAEEYGMTLCGFVKKDRFNVYSGTERVV